MRASLAPSRGSGRGRRILVAAILSLVTTLAPAAAQDDSARPQSAMGARPGTSDTPECHVGTATVRYVKPIRLDELVETRTRIDRLGTASMTWTVELHGEGGDDLRAAIELVYVGVDLATGRSKALPEAFKAQVRAFQGE